MKFVVAPFGSFFHKQLQKNFSSNELFYFLTGFGSQSTGHLPSFSKQNSLLGFSLYYDICLNLGKSIFFLIFLHEDGSMIRNFIFINAKDFLPDHFANKKFYGPICHFFAVKKRFTLR